MFYLLLAVVVRIYDLFQRYGPSNRLLTWLRRRDNLKWGVPSMLLGATYLLAAASIASWVRDGGPGWANLLFLVAFLDALKFLLFGPVSLVLLAMASIREARARRRERRAVLTVMPVPSAHRR